MKNYVVWDAFRLEIPILVVLAFVEFQKKIEMKKKKQNAKNVDAKDVQVAIDLFTYTLNFLTKNIKKLIFNYNDILLLYFKSLIKILSSKKQRIITYLN